MQTPWPARNRAGGIPRWPAHVQDLLCTECEFVIGPILLEFYTGVPIDIIADEAVAACVSLDLYPEEVCRGSVELAIVSFVHSSDGLSFLTENRFPRGQC